MLSTESEEKTELDKMIMLSWYSHVAETNKKNKTFSYPEST
jgi:hypothetical protein